MLIAQTPLRISFGGGGTDLEAYYQRFGGVVVSAAITRYCYVILHNRADSAIHLSSADYHTWETFMDGERITLQPPLTHLKAAVNWCHENGGLPGGIDLFSASEVATGSGLGSSSALMVALVHALSTFGQRQMTAQQLAEVACSLEIDRLGMYIGKQDQYACALGGLNTIEFTADAVTVTPLALPPAVSAALEARLMLFSTGLTHRSTDILESQHADTRRQEETFETLHHMKALALEMKAALIQEDLDQFGGLLDRAWKAKKSLSSRVSSSKIDQWYAAALEAGATGGKIAGAGGGGFLLLYCSPAHQDAVRTALTQLELHEMTFGFDFIGSRSMHLADGSRVS